jgi:hypothetical protein
MEQAQVRSNAEIIIETAGDHEHPNSPIALGSPSAVF